MCGSVSATSYGENSIFVKFTTRYKEKVFKFLYGSDSRRVYRDPLILLNIEEDKTVASIYIYSKFPYQELP